MSKQSSLSHLYFIGIAGHAMSGLAVAAKQKGYRVSGVAVGAYPPSTDVLAAAGIHWHDQYSADHIEVDMTVVLANAITAENVELRRAQELDIKILSFPELLEEWTAKQKRIVVAGTHGKTTTATMIAWMADQAGKPVDFMMGMSSINFGVSARHTDASVVVLEGDEYASSVLDQSSKFSHYHPDVLIVTSLEWDHPDLFPEFSLMQQRFVELVEQMPVDGLLIANADEATVKDLATHAPCPVVYYSAQAVSAEYMAHRLEYGRTETRFAYLSHGRDHGTVRLSLAGEHNVSNALVALAAAEWLAIPFSSVVTGLLSFKGAKRRFELAGEVNGVTVLDDYAHHPSEVAATLAAARHRYPDGKVWAFFLPHTYSRTKALLPHFATAFNQADVVMVGEIEGAREQRSASTVTAADVLQRLPRGAQQLRYILDPAQARHMIVDNVTEGDVVVCMSVSGADNLAGKVVKALEKRWPGV